MHAPGGPDEDPTENFTSGGWTFALWDDEMDLSAAGFDGKDRELVLGRKTYEIFAGYWPYQTEDNAIARTFNAAKKHVASPVVIGRGKRLFENAVKPCALRLVGSNVSKTGVVMCTYVRTGDIQRGTVGQAKLSAKEFEVFFATLPLRQKCAM